MNIIQRTAARALGLGTQFKMTSKELYEFLTRGQQTTSGVSVTRDLAFSVSAFFACTRVLCNGFSQVPLRVYDDKNRLVREHDLYELLYRQPNGFQTSYEWREQMMLHFALGSRHYSYLNRIGERPPEEIIPLNPDNVERKWTADRRPYYVVKSDNGESREYPPELILDLSGFAWNNVDVTSTLQAAREAVGLAAATDRHAARIHAQGVSVPGVYSIEGVLTEKGYADLRKFIKENYSGDNAGQPMILDRGAKWQQLAMTSVDAQHHETRRQQVEDVCRYFGMLPVMIGHADKALTYASAEQMFIAHVVHCLGPLYRRAEQRFEMQLLSKADKAAGLHIRHSVSALMRGASRDRAEYFKAALGAGGSPPWMSQDEIRDLDELPPFGGDAAVLPKPQQSAGAGQPVVPGPKGADNTDSSKE